MKRYRVVVNGQVFEVEVEEISDQPSPVRERTETPATTPAEPPPKEVTRAETAREKGISEAERVEAGPRPPASGETVTAPLPGVVLDVRVTKGQSVRAGDVLVILEAMKMENEIVAPVAGTVVEVYAQKGSSVDAGDPLVVIA